MGDGRPNVQRPLAVPVGQAHSRLDDAVRRGPERVGASSLYLPVSFSGPLVTADFSPPFPIPNGHRIDAAAMVLTTAGSTDTVVDFDLDGSSVFTLTLTSGSTATFTKYLNQTSGLLIAGIGRIFTISITTAGSGASDLGGWVRWITE